MMASVGNCSKATPLKRPISHNFERICTSIHCTQKIATKCLCHAKTDLTVGTASRLFSCSDSTGLNYMIILLIKIMNGTAERPVGHIGALSAVCSATACRGREDSRPLHDRLPKLAMVRAAAHYRDMQASSPRHVVRQQSRSNPVHHPQYSTCNHYLQQAPVRPQQLVEVMKESACSGAGVPGCTVAV
jgi:hypothetical protein